MWKKSRVLIIDVVQSDVHQCTRRLVLPLGVTSESPARVAACTRVLHGPGLGPRAGPGRASMIFCGPGRVRA